MEQKQWNNDNEERDLLLDVLAVLAAAAAAAADRGPPDKAPHGKPRGRGAQPLSRSSTTGPNARKHRPHMHCRGTTSYCYCICVAAAASTGPRPDAPRGGTTPRAAQGQALGAAGGPTGKALLLNQLVWCT